MNTKKRRICCSQNVSVVPNKVFSTQKVELNGDKIVDALYLFGCGNGDTKEVYITTELVQAAKW